jgi:hypothetical protein
MGTPNPHVSFFIGPDRMTPGKLLNPMRVTSYTGGVYGAEVLFVNPIQGGCRTWSKTRVEQLFTLRRCCSALRTYRNEDERSH